MDRLLFPVRWLTPKILAWRSSQRSLWQISTATGAIGITLTLLLFWHQSSGANSTSAEDLTEQLGDSDSDAPEWNPAIADEPAPKLPDELAQEVEDRFQLPAHQVGKPVSDIFVAEDAPQVNQAPLHAPAQENDDPFRLDQDKHEPPTEAAPIGATGAAPVVEPPQENTELVLAPSLENHTADAPALSLPEVPQEAPKAAEPEPPALALESTIPSEAEQPHLSANTAPSEQIQIANATPTRTIARSNAGPPRGFDDDDSKSEESPAASPRRPTPAVKQAPPRQNAPVGRPDRKASNDDDDDQGFPRSKKAPPARKVPLSPATAESLAPQGNPLSDAEPDQRNRTPVIRTDSGDAEPAAQRQAPSSATTVGADDTFEINRHARDAGAAEEPAPASAASVPEVPEPALRPQTSQRRSPAQQPPDDAFADPKGNPVPASPEPRPESVPPQAAQGRFPSRQVPRLVMEIQAPRQVALGETVSLQFKISNLGTAPATGVVALDRVPEGLRHRESADLEYRIGRLAPGESRYAQLTVIAERPGLTLNRAIVTADGGIAAEETVRFEIVERRVAITYAAPERSVLGCGAVWSATVRNSGKEPLEEIEAVADLPAGVKFEGASAGGQFDTQSQSVVWRIPRLAPGEQQVLQIRVTNAALGAQASIVRVRDARGEAGLARLATRVECPAANADY